MITEQFTSTIIAAYGNHNKDEHGLGEETCSTLPWEKCASSQSNAACGHIFLQRRTQLCIHCSIMLYDNAFIGLL